MFYKELGEILREGRKAASLSQNDVALRMGLTNQNISSWELGKSKIDMNQLQALCDMYGLDFSGVVVRAAKKTPADAAAGPHVPDEFAALLSRLNKAGRDELALYGTFLAAQPEYRASEDERRQMTPVRTIRDYLTPAAAGYASPVDGEDYVAVPVDENTPRSADFSVHVQGDSMEPYIRDGDRVFVQRDVTLTDGDVGIFFVDGDVYCKQICQDNYRNIYLLSANPKREDANLTIRSDSARSFVCFGKVLLPRRLPMPVYD
jgi:phage repressor protein C with HTH and peptisase S24 domain